MEIIKKINNNVALASIAGKDAIVMGKGIGFPKTPYKLDDKNKVERIFYNLDPLYYDLFNELAYDLIILSQEIYLMARDRLDYRISNKVVLSLADHISFSLERIEENIDLKNPLEREINYFYKEEVLIGYKAIDMIEERYKLRLPDSEAASIALHFINASNGGASFADTYLMTEILRDVFQIIEDYFQLDLDSNSYEYSRFVTHLRYFVIRKLNDNIYKEDNIFLFDIYKLKYREVYKAALLIEKYFWDSYSWKISKDELLYLMIHIGNLIRS